jgi:hypothetical protein
MNHLRGNKTTSTVSFCWGKFVNVCKSPKSLPQSSIVAIQVGRQRASCSEEPGARGIIAVCVDGWGVLYMLYDVHELLVRVLKF